MDGRGADYEHGCWELCERSSSICGFRDWVETLCGVLVVRISCLFGVNWSALTTSSCMVLFFSKCWISCEHVLGDLGYLLVDD